MAESTLKKATGSETCRLPERYGGQPECSSRSQSFPKRRRSNPKNDACHYFSIGDAMFFWGKKWLFLAIFALGQAKRVKNTHARCVKNTQAKRLAKRKKTANLTVGGLLICDRLAYSPLSSATNTAR